MFRQERDIVRITLHVGERHWLGISHSRINKPPANLFRHILVLRDVPRPARQRLTLTQHPRISPRPQPTRLKRPPLILDMGVFR
jgi:hypothetical protein